MTASIARPTAQVPAGRVRWLPTIAALWAAIHAVFGVWWVVDPAAWPFAGEGGPSSVLELLDARTGAVAFTAAAVLGLVVALGMRSDRAPVGVRRTLLVAAAGLAVLFTAVVPDGRAIILLGYMTALATPLGLVALAVVGSVRHWQIRILALALVAVGAVGLVTGWADGTVIAAIAVGVFTGVVNNGLGPWHVFGVLAGGVVWTALAIAYFRQGRHRCVPCGRPSARWTEPAAAARWGRWVTIVAACCPLPYALIRYTWLTPWPIGFDAADLAATPGIRLFGLFLGSGALLGSILTTGLISRWGERWPFWMPMLAGRPIPWPVAVVPATVVTAALVAAGQSFTVDAVHVALTGNVYELLTLAAIPFVLWAVSLGAATLAYYYGRRGQCGSCGRG